MARLGDRTNWLSRLSGPRHGWRFVTEPRVGQSSFGSAGAPALGAGGRRFETCCPDH